MENSKKVFSELVKLIEKRSNEVIEEIKAQEKADLDQGTKLQKKLEGGITELKKREGVLEDLIQTEDNIQFLQVHLHALSKSFMTAYQELYIITHFLKYLTLIGLWWHSVVRYFLIFAVDYGNAVYQSAHLGN